MTGRLELPQSNNLPELHRIFRNLNRRLESMESGQSTTGTAAATTAAATGTSGGSGGSSSSSSSSSTTQTASPITVEFIRFLGLQMDPADGLVAVDSNGYALFEEGITPISSQGLTAFTLAVPIAGGTLTWNVPSSFDGTVSYVDLEGPINSDLTVFFNPASQQVVFSNDTTNPAGGTAFAVRVALAAQTPADSGILVPTNGLAWVQVNAAGTALELVPPHA